MQRESFLSVDMLLTSSEETSAQIGISKKGV